MSDHRRLGRELGIFHSSPLVGAGLPIWLPDGAAARHAIEEYLRELERRNGYQHVYSPPLARAEMYERSGHLAHFADEMFAPVRDGEQDLYLRPSLCPHHAMVYASRGRSYRELPLRIAELGPMYRDERSGVLGGLSRVRAVSLNDAHLFCAPEQVAGEVADVLRLMRQAHGAVGVRPARYRLSLPGGQAKHAAGIDWAAAVEPLRAGLVAAGLPFVEEVGEAAFYGPKIDVQVVDPAGRESTLSTIQVDLLQPARFGLSYAGPGGERSTPVLVHRSLLGSLERLMAYLLEARDGWLPAWCAPVQVAVLPVAEDQAQPAHAFARQAMVAGLRVVEWADGPLGDRVHRARQRRVPYVVVIGAREAAEARVSLRGPADGSNRRGGASVGYAIAQALSILFEGCAKPL